MNIGVAVLTAVSDVGEDWLDVALNAGYRLVHAAQRIPRLIVIKFRNCADRPPSVGRVAVLTGNVQIAVRTVSARRSLRLSGDSGQRQQQYGPKIKHAPRRPHVLPLACGAPLQKEMTGTWPQLKQFSVHLR